MIVLAAGWDGFWIMVGLIGFGMAMNMKTANILMLIRAATMADIREESQKRSDKAAARREELRQRRSEAAKKGAATRAAKKKLVNGPTVHTT